MRNVLLVLVLLYAGLISGFTVPSSVPELSDEEKATLAENNEIQTNETKMSTNSELNVFSTDFGRTNANNVNLEDNRAGIDEKALYEYATEKVNNLNERSFLFINQRFKTPIRAQLYNSQFRDLNFNNKHQLSKTDYGLPLSIEFPKILDTGFFQPSIDELINPNIVHTDYNHRCNDKNKIKDMKDVHGSKDKHTKKAKLLTPNKSTDDQRSYLELLKPPLLRPVLNDNDHKFNADDKNYKKLPSAGYYVHNFRTNQKNPKIQTLSNNDQTRNNNIKHANELSSLYSIQKPVFISNHLKPDDINFRNEPIGAVETQRTVINNNDEDRQMDRYLKDNYGEQVNDRIYDNYNDCNYRDCVIAAGKQQTDMQPHTNIKPDCKCKLKLNLKDSNSNLHRDRLEREETVYKPNPTPQSFEINDYDVILHEENSVKFVNDELLKTVNKLNDTLQMY